MPALFHGGLVARCLPRPPVSFFSPFSAFFPAFSPARVRTHDERGRAVGEEARREARDTRPAEAASTLSVHLLLARCIRRAAA